MHGQGRFRTFTLEERLHNAGLQYLRRRRKSIVTKQYLQPRIDFCHTVLSTPASELRRWAYTDGTVFFLDRTNEERGHSKRAALGAYVWRKADRSDALYQDCIGPSSYIKGQGTPVRIWGVLAEGVLRVHILAEGEVMDQHLYAELIETRFEDWLGSCDLLVQDFERCLRCAGPRHELQSRARANRAYLARYWITLIRLHY